MATILILYSSTDGHTKAICDRLKHVIEQSVNEVTLLSIDDYQQVNLSSFEKIVIGASIRYGRHRQSVRDFIRSHLPLLESKSNAFFSVNIVARKPGKDAPETNPYLRKFLRSIAWRPNKVAVFAGKLNYPRYGYLDRSMIRLIMWITKGPTDSSKTTEFTDRQKVDEFGQELGRSSMPDIP